MAAPGEGGRRVGRGAAGPLSAPLLPSGIRLVALDLDGVCWRGSELLPGVADALAEVVRRGLDLRYVTNNSTAHRAAVSQRLARFGLPCGPERVLTSGFVTARWLRARLPEGAPVLVVGEAGLLQELAEAGLAPYRVGEEGASGGGLSDSGGLGAGPAGETPAGETPAAVVVGMDRHFSFESLAQAQAAVRAGALFVATNRDATFPTPTGLLPGAGAVVAAVATAAGQEPVVMGKPGLALAEALADLTGVPAAQTLLVGDRLSTDIAMGRRAGMVTALVLTGVTSGVDLERATTAGEPDLPDYVLSGLAELPGLLDSLSASV